MILLFLPKVGAATLSGNANVFQSLMMQSNNLVPAFQNLQNLQNLQNMNNMSANMVANLAQNNNISNGMNNLNPFSAVNNQFAAQFNLAAANAAALQQLQTKQQQLISNMAQNGNVNVNLLQNANNNANNLANVMNNNNSNNNNTPSNNNNVTNALDTRQNQNQNQNQNVNNLNNANVTNMMQLNTPNTVQIVNTNVSNNNSNNSNNNNTNTNANANNQQQSNMQQFSSTNTNDTKDLITITQTQARGEINMNNNENNNNNNNRNTNNNNNTNDGYNETYSSEAYCDDVEESNEYRSQTPQKQGENERQIMSYRDYAAQNVSTRMTKEDRNDVSVEVDEEVTEYDYIERNKNTLYGDEVRIQNQANEFSRFLPKDLLNDITQNTSNNNNNNNSRNINNMNNNNNNNNNNNIQVGSYKPRYKVKDQSTMSGTGNTTNNTNNNTNTLNTGNNNNNNNLNRKQRNNGSFRRNIGKRVPLLTTHICNDLKSELNANNTDFLIVGVIGKQGVGKSTILSYLSNSFARQANGNRHETTPSKTHVFGVEAVKNLTNGSHTSYESTNIEAYVSSDDIIFLDAPPILSSNALFEASQVSLQVSLEQPNHSQSQNEIERDSRHYRDKQGRQRPGYAEYEQQDSSRLNKSSISVNEEEAGLAATTMKIWETEMIKQTMLLVLLLLLLLLLLLETFVFTI